MEEDFYGRPARNPQLDGAAKPWAPGQSGNPKGRPKGCINRRTLSEAFIKALFTDFGMHGKRVIAKVRMRQPEEYLKLVARLVPQELDVGGSIDISSESLRTSVLSKLDSILAGGAAQSVDGEPDGQ